MLQTHTLSSAQHAVACSSSCSCSARRCLRCSTVSVGGSLSEGCAHRTVTARRGPCKVRTSVVALPQRQSCWLAHMMIHCHAGRPTQSRCYQLRAQAVIHQILRAQAQRQAAAVRCAPTCRGVQRGVAPPLSIIRRQYRGMSSDNRVHKISHP